MTGREAFNRAMQLLGYVNGLGTRTDNALLKKAMSIIQTVYADLYYVCEKSGEYDEPKSMDEEIKLPDRVVNDCFVYGVAMWLAQSENDGDNQRLFADLYQQKRAGGSHWADRIDIFRGDGDSEIS